MITVTAHYRDKPKTDASNFPVNGKIKKREINLAIKEYTESNNVQPHYQNPSAYKCHHNIYTESAIREPLWAEPLLPFDTWS